MEEHPILFSGPMVRAILEGCKTQTRRVIKPQFGQAWGWGVKHGDNIFSVHVDIKMPDGTWKWIRCPYGQLGDLLWVRETWAMSGLNRVEYRAFPADGSDFRCVTRWQPSIHMPRKYSRLTLRITCVRVQRLQEISEEDARSEGIEIKAAYGVDKRSRDILTLDAFQALWDSINSARGFSWNSNPFVWCLTFERITT